MRMLSLGVASIVAALTVSLGGAGVRPEDLALRTEIESRFDVVPLSNGIGLRPKASNSDVRLIEVSDAISVNGVVVTGRELRERVGADADTILKLSYLDPRSGGRCLPTRPSPRQRPETPRARGPRPAGAPIASGIAGARPSGGDRVRIFGDVAVRRRGGHSGQVVAVFGSVRLTGKSAIRWWRCSARRFLWPQAVVHGDIVSVGGRVRRTAGADVRGGVTECRSRTRHQYPACALARRPRVPVAVQRFRRCVPAPDRHRVPGPPAAAVRLDGDGRGAISVERSAQRVSDNPIKADARRPGRRGVSCRCWS